MTGEPQEVDDSLRQQMDALNSQVPTSENGTDFDGFASVYALLPEVPMSNTLGGDLTLNFGPEHTNMRVRPLAAFGGNLIVRDLTAPRSVQQSPRYYFFRGSMYFPDGAVQKYGSEAVSNAVTFLLGMGKSVVASLDNGVNVAYNPHTFCRDAQLVYAPAYTVEQLRDKSVRTRAATSSILGMLLTVQPIPNQPLTLFAESCYELSPPMRQVTHRVGSDYRQLLSFIPDAPDHLHR